MFETIQAALLKKTREFHYNIKGHDIDITAIKKATDNIKNANLHEYIDIEQDDFFDTKKESQGKLHILFNPPYDERIGIKTEEFYEDIGNTLKRNYPGTTAWMITANLEALKFVGLRPSRKIKVFNGALEARLVKYDMYEGSKKSALDSLNA
jgi:putative N6-adenine-specific DNA methylase